MQPSIEKILKFLKLEIERGYDNRAVVGGLERVLPIWETEARMEKIPEETIIKTRELIAEYTLNTEERAQTIKAVWQELANLSPGKTPAFPVEKTQAGPTSPVQPNQSKPKAPTVNNPSSTRTPSRVDKNSPRIGLNAPLTVVQGVGAKHAQT